MPNEVKRVVAPDEITEKTYGHGTGCAYVCLYGNDQCPFKAITCGECKWHTDTLGIERIYAGDTVIEFDDGSVKLEKAAQS